MAKAVKSVAPSAEVREKEQEVAFVLELAGWRRATGGWTHPRLSNVWPTQAAAQLQKDTEDGQQGLVFDMVRGVA